jgi:hypothetical protein
MEHHTPFDPQRIIGIAAFGNARKTRRASGRRGRSAWRLLQWCASSVVHVNVCTREERFSCHRMGPVMGNGSHPSRHETQNIETTEKQIGESAGSLRRAAASPAKLRRWADGGTTELKWFRAGGWNPVAECMRLMQGGQAASGVLFAFGPIGVLSFFLGGL